MQNWWTQSRKLVMGPGQKFLTRVGLGQFFVARVGSGQPSLVWVWKIASKNFQFLNLIFGWLNIVPASYLLRVKSMLGSGQVTSL